MLSATTLAPGDRLVLKPRSHGVAFVAGMIGALAISVLMSIGVWLQWSPFRLEMLLGSVITGRMDWASWAIGLGWHILNGGLFALAYNVAFRVLGVGGARVGAILSLFHWVVAGLLMSMLFAMQPALVVRLGAPGVFAWWGLGGVSFFGSLLLHLVFGTIVGTICRPTLTSERRLLREELERDKRRAA